jgi:membrane protein DedA with SNARE-associated domain
MHYDVLLNLVQQYGYPALFFALWLGIVGMPIPDEVIVMTGGLVTALGLLNPIPAFILTYLGVISGLSLGYILGLRLGAPVLDRLVQRKKAAIYLTKAQTMLGQFGHYALALSYFLPVVRHLVPYLAGMGKMPYRKYAAYSYTTGFLWTLIYFVVGRFFGNHIDQIAKLITEYGWYTLACIVITGLIVWRVRRPAKPSPII